VPATTTAELKHLSWVKGVFGKWEQVPVVLRVSVCDDCIGLRHIPGPKQDVAGYKGKVKQERTFVLVCPVHGRREPVDVEGVGWYYRTNKATGKPYKSVAKVKTKGGRAVSLLVWSERSR
jgi:hypothetical protein